MSSPPHRSPKAALLLGAAWTVGGRWAMKAIGFVNTIVMARLLLPADYGVVAMAMLAVGLIQALLDFNAGTALLRKAEVGKDEIDSAWSLGILQGVSTGLLLALASPLLAVYFKEPRVVWVLVVLAACMPLSSMGNIGLVLAQKHYDFALIFRHQVACKLVGVFATLAAGWVLRDYRALVIGMVSGQVASVVLSYTMHPYRPRWDTRRIAEIWGLTKWLMFSGMAQYCLRRGDELIASRIGSTREFGLYNVGADFGQLPTGEVGPALLRALLPVLASLQNDFARANAALIKTAAALNAVTLPIGFGFAVLAAPATALVLGPKWTEAVPFVVIFALVNTVQLMGNPVNTLLIMRGYTKLQSHLVWLEFGMFVALATLLISPLGFGMGLVGLALARLGSAVLNVLSTTAVARARCGLSLRQMAFAVGRPTLGAALMAALIAALLPLTASPIGQIALGVTAGGAFYLLWAFATWQLARRPEGAESTLVDALQRWRATRALGGSAP